MRTIFNELKQRAKEGCAEGIRNFAFAYSIGYYVEQDHSVAAKLYRQAAEMGDAYAQYYLGDCYANGKGVEQSYNEALKWYRKADEQGHPFACTTIYELLKKHFAHFYAESDRLYEKYMDYVTTLANGGNVYAQFALGQCYEKGLGVEQDIKKALEWYNHAARRGDVEAVFAIEKLENTNSNNKID